MTNVLATWNTTGLVSTTLSKGNVVANANSNTNTPQAFGGAGYTSGKFYIECTSVTAVNGYAVGVANSSQSNFLGINNNGAGFYAGSNQFSDFATAGPGTFTNGDILGMAVDYTAKKMWIRKNGGTWFPGAGADPATGTGGFSFSLVTGTLFPIIKLGAPSSTTVSANFGRQTFGATAPSGYSGYTIPQANPGGVTWSATDKTNMTISGGTIAVATAAGSWTSLVRANVGFISGKFYSEFSVVANVGTGDGSWAIGIANTSQSNFIGTNLANAQGYYALSGHMSDFATTYATAANGHIVRLCIDYGAQLFWVAVDGGNWNNNALNNPATGVGGYDISSVLGELFPVYEANAIGTTTTGNFGSTAFTFTTPVGFGGYNGTIPPGGNNLGGFFMGML